MKLGVLATHPIQYHAPLFRALARELDLHVYFAHRQTAEGQAAAGFGVAFEWDVDLLGGYSHTFLDNHARRPSTDTWAGCSTPDIARIIAHERFDAFLVTGWYNRSFWQAMAACWRTGTPLLVRGDSQLATPRSWTKRAVKEVVYRGFIPRFDGYLVVGERSRDYYLHYGADPARMHLVPHFVDNELFRAGAEGAGWGSALREELGYSDDTLSLLFVGKFIPEKQPLVLFQAAARLRERGYDARLLLVGAGQLEGALRAEADRTGMPAHFAGFKNQTELPAYYAAADLLALPSVSETWGLVVNEAFACRTPAVVSDAVGCGPDLVDEGRTGAVFPVGDIAAFADAVERLVPRLGSDAVTRALAEKVKVYSLERAAEGTLDAVRAARPAPTP